MSRFLLNIEKRSLPGLMLSGVGLASKDAVLVFVPLREVVWVSLAQF